MSGGQTSHQTCVGLQYLEEVAGASIHFDLVTVGGEGMGGPLRAPTTPSHAPETQQFLYLLLRRLEGLIGPAKNVSE